jgi:hypothetical protein
VTRALSLGLGLFALLLGCSRREGTPRGSPAPAAPAPASDARPAKASYEALGRRPPNPRRAEPPPSIAERALAVGARAPEVRLPSSVGPYVLDEALYKHARVLLVFYRGDW